MVLKLSFKSLKMCQNETMKKRVSNTFFVFIFKNLVYYECQFKKNV